MPSYQSCRACPLRRAPRLFPLRRRLVPRSGRSMGAKNFLPVRQRARSLSTSGQLLQERSRLLAEAQPKMKSSCLRSPSFVVDTNRNSFSPASLRIRHGFEDFFAIRFFTELFATTPFEKLHITADCPVNDQLISLARNQ